MAIVGNGLSTNHGRYTGFIRHADGSETPSTLPHVYIDDVLEALDEEEFNDGDELVIQYASPK